MGYVTYKDSSGIYVVVWPPGAIAMEIKLPAPTGTLLDGSTSYSTPVLAAMQTWNTQIGVVQLNGLTVAQGETYANGNGRNEIVIDAKADGEDFSANTLAVTLSYRQGNVRTEADIVFNQAYTWDSYRGGLRSGRQDIQRVAVHELGHVLGLLHPDKAEPPQVVNAIMNSTASNVETPRTDDINGVQSLYGAPGVSPVNDAFANSIAMNVTGASAQVIGATIGGTAQSGEPKHDTESPSHSIWWRWTAANATPVTLTTYGSNFDTVLGVYTGSSLNGLTKVASNDDEERGVIRTSKLSFTPTAGTSYQIAVDGWDGSYGQVTLTLTQGESTGSAPTITTGPASQTVTVGGAVTFTVTASGSPTDYQWYFNGSPISNATTSAYSLGNVASTHAGSYSVIASNAAGSATSAAAGLTVVEPTLTTQAVTTGHDVSFSAPVLSGSYQWQFSTNSGSTWSDLASGANYSGVTTPTLNISAANASFNNNRYRYVISNDGGSATSAAIILTVSPALIPFPVAIAVDGSGNLYVADSSTHVIQQVDPSNRVATFAGTSGSTGSVDGPGTTARFNQPGGISSAANATLTVADTANATIRRVSSSGVVTLIAGSPTIRSNLDGAGTAATFSLPIGLAQNSLGTFYIADATNHTIRALNSSNVVSTFAGSAGNSGSTDGTGSAARFNYPTGIAVDAAGNVYVADTTNNLIRKITPAGVVSTLAGVVGVSGWQDGSGALLNQPGGLAVDASGNLYVADTANSVIRKITPAGQVSTLAGLSTIGGLKDGTGSGAWFNQPRAVAVDGSGNIYVADAGNAALRKITPAGVVTTLALTAAPISSGGTGSTGSGSGGTTTPSSSGSSGGGGGGAPSAWFFGALCLLLLVRWYRRCR